MTFCDTTAGIGPQIARLSLLCQFIRMLHMASLHEGEKPFNRVCESREFIRILRIASLHEGEKILICIYYSREFYWNCSRHANLVHERIKAFKHNFCVNRKLAWIKMLFQFIDDMLIQSMKEKSHSKFIIRYDRPALCS